MSSDHIPRGEPGPAESPEIRAAAAGWIQRRATGMSAAESEEFRRWLAADPRHSAMIAKMNTAGDDCDWMWHAGAVDEVAAALEQRKVRRRLRRRRAAAFTGAVAALVFLALVWQVRPSASNVGLASASTLVVVEPQRRTLPDGSIVELKTGAKIAVEFTGKWRRVALQRGEAHFHVVRDDARPFIVATTGIEVRALGTVFTVERKRSSIDVLVTEGRVAVDKPAAPAGRVADPPLVAPLAFVDAGNRVSVPIAEPAVAAVVPVSETELTELLGWRIPRLDFTVTPLRDVVDGFNRHNRVQLALDDPVLGELRVSGVIRADRIESLIELLESDFPIKAERLNDREISLRRKH